MHAAKLIADRGCRVLFLAPTGALVHSYHNRPPVIRCAFLSRPPAGEQGGEYPRWVLLSKEFKKNGTGAA